MKKIKLLFFIIIYVSFSIWQFGNFSLEGETLQKVTSNHKTNPIKEEKIKSGDVTLFIRIVGNSHKSPVLIAINGGPGQSSHYMESLEQIADENLAIITYDQRGTGRSSESNVGYSLENQISDIEAIRLHLKKEKVHLLGHSFGGILAQRYSSLHPERIFSITLMGSGPPTMKAIVEAQIRLGVRIQKLVKDGIITGHPPAIASELVKYLLPAYFSNPKFTIPQEILKSTFHPKVSQKTFSDSGYWDFRSDLKNIKCSVLFVWGEEDPFGIEMSQITTKALINAKLEYVTLKKCGHYWQENTNDFFILVKNFLKKQ